MKKYYLEIAIVFGIICTFGVLSYTIITLDEIEELEQKRNKYKMIKEGMMQQLLTGRIRLKWKK